MLPSAARWSRQAATSRGVTADTRSWPSPVASQPVNLSRCRGDLPGDLVGPDAPYRQVEVPLRPHGKAVIGLSRTPIKTDYLAFREVILRDPGPSGWGRLLLGGVPG
jgi:hypothetical protein